MMRIAALIAFLGLPFGLGRLFGADKVKHFLMSALVQSIGFSIARAAGAPKGGSQIAGAVAAGSIGVWKEIHDARSGKPFSVADLAADAAGAGAAASLLNGTRDR